MRNLFIALSIYLATCTGCTAQSRATDVAYATNAAVCSLADYSTVVKILDSSASVETKIVELATEVGPDVLKCLLQAKAATTVAAGSGV